MIRSSDLPPHDVCLALDDSGNGTTRPDLQKKTTTLAKSIEIGNSHERVSNTLAVIPAKSQRQTGYSRSISQLSHRMPAIKSP